MGETALQNATKDMTVAYPRKFNKFAEVSTLSGAPEL
jgi:hypothetical protein